MISLIRLHSPKLLALAEAATPFLVMLCLFFVGAVLAHAQMPAMPSEAPPGSISASAGLAVGWFRWGFGVLAVVLLIMSLIGFAKHPGLAATGVIATIFCIILAAEAPAITAALYRPV